MAMPKSALEGIRVIDLGRYQAGPRIGLVLARLGAEELERSGGIDIALADLAAGLEVGIDRALGLRIGDPEHRRAAAAHVDIAVGGLDHHQLRRADGALDAGAGLELGHFDHPRKRE